MVVSVSYGRMSNEDIIVGELSPKDGIYKAGKICHTRT
jgi:hypothetical protein